MIRMEVKTTGLSVLSFDKRELRKSMRVVGNEIARAARGLVRGGPSTAGNPPGRRSGALSKSIKVFVFKSGEGVAVRARRFYSRFLEDGAKGPGKRVLEPRPFMSAALSARSASINDRLKTSVEAGIKLTPLRGKLT